MSDRSTVYLLWHAGESDPYEGPLLLGVYSTREHADARLAEAVQQPGFRDNPDGFEISTHVVDADAWTEGFATYEYPLDASTGDETSS